ncbi:PPE family protein [Mycobacterium kansasii]|uniref:PPE family protein n=1 Tax=Mycobacterium kansasii TaxID=1768 RepID=A0A1V3X3K2_MYCKA|nr:PPE family protein [Mycobacterium kansasii]
MHALQPGTDASHELFRVAAGDQLAADVCRRGAQPMLAAATAWGSLADELQAAASSFTTVTSGLANGAWQGPAAAAMAAAAAPTPVG